MYSLFICFGGFSILICDRPDSSKIEAVPAILASNFLKGLSLLSMLEYGQSD